MNTPVRWLDDPTLAADLRADLECVQQHPFQPDLARAAESLDAALAAEPSLTPPGEAAKLAAPSGMAHGSLALKLAIAALGGGVIFAAASWQQRASTHVVPARAAPISAAQPSAAPGRRALSTPRALEPAPAVPAAPEASTSRREIEQLQRIQATLARDPAQAYRLARASLSEIPHGPLREEREGLAVIALWQSGDHAAARALAQRFVASYPESPLRQRIEALLASERVL